MSRPESRPIIAEATNAFLSYFFEARLLFEPPQPQKMKPSDSSEGFRV